MSGKGKAKSKPAATPKDEPKAKSAAKPKAEPKVKAAAKRLQPDDMESDGPLAKAPCLHCQGSVGEMCCSEFGRRLPCISPTFHSRSSRGRVTGNLLSCP